MTESSLILDIRREMDEITLSGEEMLTDAQMEDLASSNFSDEDLAERIMNACMYVASIVRARFVPDLIEISAPNDIPFSGVVRLLGDRVSVSNKRAVRRTFNADRKLEASGRGATEEYPTYTWEEAELQIRADELYRSVTPTILSGILIPSLLASASVGYVREPNGPVDIPERFRAAIIAYVAADCFLTMSLAGLYQEAMTALREEVTPYILPRRSTDDR